MNKKVLIIIIVYFSSIIVLRAGNSNTENDSETETSKIRFEQEYDLYYTNFGLYFPLTGTPIPQSTETNELIIYRDLLFSSLIPRYMVIEGSVNPMPSFGVLIRDSSEEFYHKAKVNNNLNLIHAVTAGFEEPYAASVFLGNVISFRSPKDEWRSGNFGYMGYLASFGAHHINDNILIDDIWYELEWKIKGDQIFPVHSYHWNFRIGTKQHRNEYITDVMYISVRRSRLDFNAPVLSLFKNSGFEYTFFFDYKKMVQMKHVFYIEKKWPFTFMKAAFTIAFGFIWESPEIYSGPLGDREGRDNFIIVTRPNIEF